MISTELPVTRAVERYEADGWCDVPQPLPTELVVRVRKRIEEIARTRRPEVTYENGSDIARAIHGCHRYDEVCMELVTSPALVNLAEAITKSEVYVYQFKVNVKSAREGKRWPWHQDFTFWNQEDGMPRPDAVTIAVNLDRAHNDNGPLTVLAGSHKLGMLESCAMKEKGFRSNWRDDVSENLSHTIPDEVVREISPDFPEVRFTGDPGFATAFHPCAIHSSAPNLSPDRRSVLYITYNATTNTPAAPSRPAFLVDRDTTPVVASS